MREVLIMLNNYFNDMFVSMVFVTALFMWAITKYLPSWREDTRELVLYLYERFRTIFVLAFAMAVAGSLLRALDGTELNDMAAKGFSTTLWFKYGLLVFMLFSSLWLWLRIDRGIGRQHSKTA